MKINMFVVSLLALVKTFAVTVGTFLLMILVFNDNLDPLKRSDEIFLYIFLGLFFYSLASIAYVFAILLPAYYIDKKNYEAMDFKALFSRHAPVIAAIVTLLAVFVVLVSGKEGLQNGMLQCNIFTTYVTVFTGLLFFELQVKHAMDKTSKKTSAGTL
jgi:hypothetical protein